MLWGVGVGVLPTSPGSDAVELIVTGDVEECVPAELGRDIAGDCRGAGEPSAKPDL